MVQRNEMEGRMPSWRNKPEHKKQDFLKRRSFEQGKAEVDAAHRATQRLYCDALRFWRHCDRPSCRRHRHCLGDPTHCLGRGHFRVPPSKRLRAQQEVIAGGARRIAPATHVEWTVRRVPFFDLMKWAFG
jgi:hypothetical protein